MDMADMMDNSSDLCKEKQTPLSKGLAPAAVTNEAFISSFRTAKNTCVFSSRAAEKEAVTKKKTT